MRNSERSTWETNSCCRNPHFLPSFSFKEEEGDLCISTAPCLRDEEKSCAVPYSLAQWESNLLSALSFIIPLQNPLLLCYAPAKIPFIAIKKAAEVPFFIITIRTEPSK